MAKKQTIIKALPLFDGKKFRKQSYVIIEGKQIVDVCKGSFKADFEGFVTPALIDAHSHIGMARGGEGSQGTESNEFLEQIYPLSDPINSIYFDDPYFQHAVDFGVLYSCIIPGSGNLFGGQAKVIRNYARNIDECLVHDYGYKMALGYNPRSTTGWKGLRPNTRMGTYALLEKTFDEVLQKEAKAILERDKKLAELEKESKEKKLSKSETKQRTARIEEEFKLSLTNEEQHILNVVKGERPVKVHVHKEDDVIYLLSLIERYNLKPSFEHICDVSSKRIFSKIAKTGFPVVYGPLGTFAYKVELKNESYKNIKAMLDSGLEFGLMTDHPVIDVAALRDSLKFFLIQGMEEAEALSLITSKNAKMLDIQSFLGEIKPGYWASLLVWDRDPLHLGAMPRTVIAEGKVLRR